MSMSQERQLLPTLWQQISSQMPLQKSLKRKDICLNRYLMQMKVPYSGKNNATKDIISKGEK